MPELSLIQITQMLEWAFWLFVANLILRTAVFHTLRHFGAYDPRFDYFWPRLPWRPFYRVFEWFRAWWEENISTGRKNTDGFSSFLSSLSAQLKPGDFLIGRVRLPYLGGWYQPIGQSISRHVMLIASTGSGKSVFLATLIALLPKRATAFIIDPKGFFSRVILTALKALGRKVQVIDALGITGWQSASVNLLAQIKELSKRVGQDVSTIMFDTLALSDIPKTETKSPFFPDTARMLWAALHAHVSSTMPNGSVIDSRRLLTVGYIEQAAGDAEFAMAMLWQTMAENPSWDGYISKVGLQMLEMSERTRNDVLATARSATKYLDHKQIQNISQRDDVQLCDLKRNDSDLIVALALPTIELRTTFNPFVTQLTAFTLKAFELIEGNINERCGFVLEELPSYGGKIEGLTESFPLLRGYGAQIIGVAQDLEQLENMGRGTASSTIGNSDITIYMGVNDAATAEYISRSVLGEKTHKKKQKNGAVHESEKRVMSPGQVKRFLEAKRNNAIVQRAGKRPMRVKVAPYWKELPVWLYTPDAEFGESAARASLRALLSSSRFASGAFSRLFDPKMSEAQARSIYGLSGRYSRSDLRQRTVFLTRKYEPRLIDQARKKLESLL